MSRAGIESGRAAIARMRRRLVAVVRDRSRETVERSVALYLGLLKFGSGRQVFRVCHVK